MDIKEKLHQIQQEIEVPKNRWNSFGNYAYRSREDIFIALKPLLAKYKCNIRQMDYMVEKGGRSFEKSVAILEDLESEQTISAQAYVEVSQEKKGMDTTQIGGAASSYAGKYAMANLFALDDGFDEDTTNKNPKIKAMPKTEATKSETVWITDAQFEQYKKLAQGSQEDRQRVQQMLDKCKRSSEFGIKREFREELQGLLDTITPEQVGE